MNIRRADMVITPRYRTSFFVALAGFLCGISTSEFQASRFGIETERYVAAADDIRAADARLAQWRENYFNASLPPAIAAMAVSPERSWQALETRKSLLSTFEKTQATGDMENLFLSDKSSILVESGQAQP